LKPSFLPYSLSVYNEYAERVKKVDSDFIYDPNYTTPESIFISNKVGIPLGLTLHEPLYSFSQSIFYTYYTLRPFFLQSLDYFLKRSIGLYLLTRSKANYISKSRYLSFIAAVSKGTLDSVKIKIQRSTSYTLEMELIKSYCNIGLLRRRTMLSSGLL
jgi:hypothetical protein